MLVEQHLVPQTLLPQLDEGQLKAPQLQLNATLPLPELGRAEVGQFVSTKLGLPQLEALCLETGQ